jgi:hypothetical protein
MSSRMKCMAFGMLIVSFIAGSAFCTDNEPNRVEVHGDRLSIHVNGIALREVLEAIEEKTGVQFWCDTSVANEIMFVDFERLPVSKGIEKIICLLNSAAIYDDKGTLRRVIILGKGEHLGGKVQGKEEGLHIGTPRGDRSRNMMSSSPPKVGSSGSGASQSPLSRKAPVSLNGPPLDKPYTTDGPPDWKNQVGAGPQQDRAYVVDGPPDPQDKGSEGPPNGGGDSVPTPSPGSEGPMDGPPLDRPYTVDGPPGFGDKGMEGPPGAGSS